MKRTMNDRDLPSILTRRPDTARSTRPQRPRRATPPPIVTRRHVSHGTKQVMRLMEAWAWLRKLPFSRSVEYIRIYPDRLPCYEELPVLSVILSENPGMYVVSSQDYFNYYVTMETESRRPNPLEYYYALEYFRKNNGASFDITNYDYSSDSDYGEDE